jgi:hypothetical protein
MEWARLVDLGAAGYIRLEAEGGEEIPTAALQELLREPALAPAWQHPVEASRVGTFT